MFEDRQMWRKVVLPAGIIDRIDVDARKVYIQLAKDHIKDSPEYDPDDYDDEYRDRSGSYYNQLWDARRPNE